MSSRTCPDWPTLMEISADLQFKHYTLAEVQLPGEALVQMPDVPLSELSLCADMDHNVFYAPHTDPRVAAALSSSHWFELGEWATTGPGRDR